MLHRLSCSPPTLIGTLMAISLLTMMARGLTLPVPLWLPVAGYWLAALLSIPGLASRNRRQSLALLVIGLGCAVVGYLQGAEISVRQMLAGNLGLISMLVAVSFLGLVSQPALDDSQRLPQGRRAVTSTLGGVHLFGAVINLSAVFILGDRMTLRRPLSREQAIALTRGFSAAAFWSPFFAAMGVALTFAPGAELATIMLAGIPLAAIALLVSLTELARINRAADFVGYPMHYRSLWLPLLLATAVFAVRYRQPEFPILTLITLLAPAVTVLILLLSPRRTVPRLTQHCCERLPRMSNELSLFLAAGVLSYGLQLLLAETPDWLPFDSFGATEASLCLAFALVMALLGIHPIISIALLGPVLAPLNPDQSLLAVVFLSAWALGSAIGPLSGMNLAVQGRYGIDALALMRWNLPYAAIMFVAVCVALQLLAWLQGTPG